MKKLIKYTFIIGLLFIILYISLIFRYGSIDIMRTVMTKYHKIENSSDRIIETSQFKIRAPNNWVHISGGPGCGGTIGTFQTSNGVIFYEYGLFAPNYNEKEDGAYYKIENKQVNRFHINIAKSENNETGISIPMQNEMKLPFTFYMDNSVRKNFDAILKGIEEIEFK